jgi:hypothetical protein
MKIMAAVNLPDEAKPLFTPDDSMPRDVLLLVAIAIFVALVAVLWAVFFRKRAKKSANRDLQDAVPAQKKLWRRRKRRERRPRNPTRAELGGLPPPREESVDR